MKKTLLVFSATLLSSLVLTACSGGEKETSKSSAEQTTTVAETTTTSTEATSLKESTVTYLSDQEIENIQTIGDFKAAFRSLMDSYIADFDELIAQVPQVGKDALQPTRDQLVKMMEEQEKTISNQLATAGDDSTELGEGKETLVSTLKSVRDQFQSGMKLAREQASTLMN